MLVVAEVLAKNGLTSHVNDWVSRVRKHVFLSAINKAENKLYHIDDMLRQQC